MQSYENLDDYLAKIFRTYDSVDLLSKFSALNLVFENQNKNLFLSKLSTYALFNPNKHKPKASSKTFRNIIEKIENDGNLHRLIDPAESSFFEYVFLDKEYGVFNGINNASAFYVNSIIQTLIYHKNNLPNDFINKALKLIKAGLTISDFIFRKLDLNFDCISDHKYIKTIVIPNNIEELKNNVTFDESLFFSILSVEEFENYFLCKIEQEKFADGLSTSDMVPFYYNHPFIKVENKIYVIDPTAICYFLRNLCVKLAKEFNCVSQFIDEYNNATATSSFYQCETISGLIPKNNKLIFTENCKIYKSKAYEISKSKAILLVCVCDTSTEDPYFAKRQHPSTIHDDLIAKSIAHLNQLGYLQKNIYSFIIFCTIFGTYSFSSGISLINHPIIVPACDLPLIQTNEDKNPFFLESFTELLNFYFNGNRCSMIFSITNLISMVSGRNYDLYVDDETRIKDLWLNLAFDFMYPYAVKALKKLKHSVAIFDGAIAPIRLIKLEENIYFNDPIFSPLQDSKLLYLKLKKFGIWAHAASSDVKGILISRAILYWINQIEGAVSKYINTTLYIQVKYNKEGRKVIKSDYNKCVLYYTDKDISPNTTLDNNNEISIVLDILKCFNLSNDDVIDMLLNKSSDKNKRTIYTLKLDSIKTFKPFNINLLPIESNKILESIWDDKLGEYLVDKLSIKFGVIDNPTDAIKDAVDYLFKEFEQFISKFEWKSALNLCYLHIESLIQKLFLYQDNMNQQVLLYPQNKDELSEIYNKINTSSVTLRFVAEYLGTIQPNGNEIMNEFDIVQALSLVSSIIRWARIDDAFKYKILKGASFLKSYRIGFDHTNLNKFNNIVSDVVFYDISHKFKFQNIRNDSWPFKKSLDEAYVYEHGFTLDDIMHVAIAFIAIGEEQESEVKYASFDKLLNFIESEKKLGVSKELFLKVIDYISIKKRDKFYDNLIKPRELHPWKYNRVHSLIRKPIIQNSNGYIWGNRMVEHLYFHLVNTIFSGKEPSSCVGKSSINTLNGKILQYSGEVFNDKCYEYLKVTMPNIDFKKRIKSINNKKIENDKGENLGDIDILGIDKTKRRIYLIETKDFFYSRDPSELDVEIKKMFTDTGNRHSFLTKEKNRVEWFKNHLKDVIKHYNLEERDWQIRYTFLTNKPLISAEFSGISINSTSLKSISIKYLRNLKDI